MLATPKHDSAKIAWEMLLGLAHAHFLWLYRIKSMQTLLRKGSLCGAVLFCNSVHGRAAICSVLRREGKGMRSWNRFESILG